MKKKILLGIVGVAAAAAIIITGIVLLSLKCTLHISEDTGYTVSVKDVTLDENGKATVRKGDTLVFAVTLDKDYSDSDIKVKANDTAILAQDGVYRYTVEKNTVITVEGVTENDHIIQGIDVDPGTLDGEKYTILRDTEGRLVPVLTELGLNAVDTYDVPNLNLTATVSEAINPGWKWRMLSEVNLGKYKALKFYVKNSNYLQAKISESEEFYVAEGSEDWHEFLFRFEDGAVNLYIDRQQKTSCNYLSDIYFCLQDKGSYKFSNIYMIPREDYQGAMLSVIEGDGFRLDILPREYTIGARLTFHVILDENFEKSSDFAVRAGNSVLEPNGDGSYTLEFNGDTTLRVLGVVGKPLDSRYQVVDSPLHVLGEETDNYALMRGIKDAKTYRYTQEIWGSIGFADVNLAKYSNILFFVKKDDTKEENWLELLQKADDETTTPYFQKNDSYWHKFEFKKEGGRMYVYVDGERNDTPIIDAEHLNFVLNTGSQIRFTSLLGIVDPNYAEPEPDYVSSAYQTIGSPVAVVGSEIENYVLVSRVSGAKTYQYTPAQWGSFGFSNVNFDKYSDLLFFIHKEDMNIKNWLEFFKADDNGKHVADYVQKNDNRWYKIKLKKVADGQFCVYVNDVKQDTMVSGADELKFTLNEKSVFQYTSLLGIPDPNYKEAEPDYISSEYKAIQQSVALAGDEIENYKRLNHVFGAATWQYVTEQWGTAGFVSLNMEKYKSILFFIHKEDMDPANWIELFQTDDSGNRTNYIQKNDNKWYQVELKKRGNTALFDVYVNGVQQEAPVSKMENLKITLNGNSVFQYTSICGILDPDYKESEPEYLSAEYKPIAQPVAVDAEEIDNYVIVSKIPEAKTYSYVSEQWGQREFTDVDLAPYKELVFFVHKEDMNTGNWVELYQRDAGNNTVGTYLQINDNEWHRIELKKDGITGSFDVYVNGTKQSVPVSKASSLKFVFGTDSIVQFTSLFGIVDPDYKPEVKGTMIVTAPWAYGKGSLDPSKTATELGYEYATLVTGENNTYAGARMMDVDLSVYKSFRFAMKSTDASWWEIGTAAENNYSLIANNASSWVEYEFKNEGDGYFTMYQDGEKKTVMLAENTNLSDLQMRFGVGGTLYMTEVRGELKEGAESALQTIAAGFTTHTGEFTAAEKPNRLATGATLVSTAWTAQMDPMASIELGLYQKILFYARRTDGSGYFESTCFGTEQLGSGWTEFKMVKNSDKTWNLYRGGVLISENLLLSNLSDITAKYGTATYYFSQVFGVYDANPEPEPTEKMITVSAWAYGDGSLDNSKTYAEKGYEYATVITGSNDTYGGRMMMDADLSLYSTFRFALKSDGNAWYEIGKTANNSFDLIQKNNAEWVEIEFKDEGNGYFQGFVNGAWVNVQLPLNMNLSDLQMKFGTSGTLVVTEVRGTLRDGASSSLKVVADSFNTKEGTEVKEERPILEATRSTRVSTTWEAAESRLTALELAPYQKILFYARKTGADHQSGWFESVDAFGQFVIHDSWTEFKLVKNADGTWNVYRAGKIVKYNQTLSDLSDITAKYGTDAYYFSQVFGVTVTGK